jgi:hypothetical protein
VGLMLEHSMWRRTDVRDYQKELEAVRRLFELLKPISRVFKR